MALVALTASTANAETPFDLVTQLMAEHGSLAYAHSFDGRAQGVIGKLSVDVASLGLGSKARLALSIDLGLAYTQEKLPAGGTDDDLGLAYTQEKFPTGGTDDDLTLGIGIGGRLVPKNNPNFALTAGIGYFPGPLHGCWHIGITVKT